MEHNLVGVARQILSTGLMMLVAVQSQSVWLYVAGLIRSPKARERKLPVPYLGLLQEHLWSSWAGGQPWSVDGKAGRLLRQGEWWYRRLSTQRVPCTP